MGGSPEVRSLRPAWPKWQNRVSTKNAKISWVWRHIPVVPATWEAEAGESLNLGGGGCSELRSCHYTPAWVKEPDYVSRKKKKITMTTSVMILGLAYETQNMLGRLLRQKSFP